MQGLILYRGASVIDGAPIVAIAIGLARPSSNVKTGPVVQIYILPDGVHPLQAVNSGADRSVCGDCPLRGRLVTKPDGSTKNVDRSCYVTLIHGPSVVHRALIDGRYTQVPLPVASRLLAGRSVRLGAYGDPGAVPVEVWEAVLGRVGNLSGYTHRWREQPLLSAFCMASVETTAERDEAKALGFRTFRVRARGTAPVTGEGQCPASAEMGHRTQCFLCKLCGGNRRPLRGDVTIEAHGTGALHFDKEFT